MKAAVISFGERVPADLMAHCFWPLVPGQLRGVSWLATILLRLHESGLAVPSATVLNGRYALRVANCNHRSRREDFDVYRDEFAGQRPAGGEQRLVERHVVGGLLERDRAAELAVEVVQHGALRRPLGTQVPVNVNIMLPGRRIVGLTMGDAETQSLIPALVRLITAVAEQTCAPKRSTTPATSSRSSPRSSRARRSRT